MVGGRFYIKVLPHRLPPGVSTTQCCHLQTVLEKSSHGLSAWLPLSRPGRPALPPISVLPRHRRPWQANAASRHPNSPREPVHCQPALRPPFPAILRANDASEPSWGQKDPEPREHRNTPGLESSSESILRALDQKHRLLLHSQPARNCTTPWQKHPAQSCECAPDVSGLPIREGTRGAVTSEPATTPPWCRWK